MEPWPALRTKRSRLNQPGLVGIVAHDAGPQGECGDGHAHGHPRMARVGGLDGVGRQHADGVGGFGFERVIEGFFENRDGGAHMNSRVKWMR